MKNLFILLSILPLYNLVNAQNVGIGTTTPASLLEVSAPQADARITWTSSSNYGRLLFTQSGVVFGALQHVGSSYATSNRQNALELYNSTPSGPVLVFTNSTERMRIDANGDVGIGTSVPFYKLHVVDASTSARCIYGENTSVGNSSGIGIAGKSANNPGYGFGVSGVGNYAGVEGQGDGTSNPFTTFGVYGSATAGTSGVTAGTMIGVFGGAGGGTDNYGVYCNGNGVYTGTWTMLSDQKFKRDMLPVEDVLQLVGQLNPVSYQLKTEEYPMMNFPSFRQYGFVAQDLEKVFPTLVENGTHPGATKEDKDIPLKSVNYIGMIPILTKAIQEQQKLIESQEQRIAKLEKAIALLMEKK